MSGHLGLLPSRMLLVAQNLLANKPPLGSSIFVWILLPLTKYNILASKRAGKGLRFSLPEHPCLWFSALEENLFFRVPLFVTLASQMCSLLCRATEISSFNILHLALPVEISTFLFLRPYSWWIRIANRASAPYWFAQRSQQPWKKSLTMQLFGK